LDGALISVDERAVIIFRHSNRFELILLRYTGHKFGLVKAEFCDFRQLDPHSSTAPFVVICTTICRR